MKIAYLYIYICMIIGPLAIKAEETFESNIRLFFSTLSKPMATRQEFIRIFGPYNEAEMASTLKKRFPNLSISSDYSRDQEVMDFLGDIQEDSDIERSEFLFCLKGIEPALSKDAFKILGRAKSRYSDMNNYWVLAGKKRYEFEYSQSGYLNNIYMPNNIDLYKLVRLCIP